MSAGLRTQRQLRKALHPDVHGDVSHVPVLTERRGTWPSRTGIDATYLMNAHGLGTPNEAARARCARIEHLWRRAFSIGGAVIVILVALGGYGYVARRDDPAVSTGVAYYVKAQNLRAGSRACELDPHEGCLVCMHKDTSGLATVSAHC